MHSSLINDAIAQYARERPRFEKAMNVVMNQCQQMLSETLIPASVQGRVKDSSSLRGKLERLSDRGDRRFSMLGNARELLDSQNDLAGVRIATYVEFDRSRVVSAIEDCFSGIVVEERDKPSGYRATHCITVLVPGGLWGELVPTRVEIQVCSMLSHVWNEIEHDIRYKELNSWNKDDSALRDGYLKQLSELRDAGEQTVEQLLALKAQVHALSLLPEIMHRVSPHVVVANSDCFILREYVRLGYLTSHSILETFFESNWFGDIKTWIDVVNQAFEALDLPSEYKLCSQAGDILLAVLLARHAQDLADLYRHTPQSQQLRAVQIANAVADIGMDPADFVREL